jgi:2-polyprenyl-3-methyl-5-hydroxy-6-metoxy-1,4-benzoquinol methylase
MIKESQKNKNWWENYFAKDGGWERNGGRDQTFLFAKKFTELIKIESNENFSIMDAGCALGGALRLFSEIYPLASLYGIDFSENAIKICEKEYGKFAVFSVGDLGDIEGFYDLIYCSNTLEHFSDFKEKSRQLICHCRQLCIMVPFQELDSKGKPILPNPNNHHQHTFDKASFDFLLAEGLATDIKTEIFSCVGAWGWTHR